MSPVAVAPAEVLWRKWLLLAATPVAGLVIVATAWTFFASSSGRQTPPVPAPVVPDEPLPVVEPPQPPEGEPQAVAVRLNPRWLPRQTRLLVSLRMSSLAGRQELRSATPLAGPAWQMVDGLVSAFGLKLEKIRRLGWASTDLGAWPDPGLVVIELEEGQDAGVFRRVGQPAGIELDGEPCRRLPKGDWPHPFVVPDELTIITGREELLRELADRSEPALESVPIDRLFKAMSPDAEAFVLLDLASAREAGWRLPTAVMDVWPAGRKAWHVVWEVPQGLGLSLQGAETGVSEAALLCEGETAAQSVHAALDELVPAAGTAIAAQRESLGQSREAGRMTEAAADGFAVLLTKAATALEAARWETDDETVWLRVNVGGDVSELVAAGLESRLAMRAAWLDAALLADEANHQRLLSGLDGYRRSEGRFPAGAAGATTLSPETRLSWIATMLPYYGREDWHEELDFRYSWNSPQNRPVTRRRLDPVINPALGPSGTEAGFPVTHYVGVAGVGPDAGTLEAGHPRAGVFGFNRTTRIEEISDGASYTIALLGVTGDLKPWAQGGSATVRALTEPPYVNGKDGFGSGQPDGMLAGMADGSVRFLSKDIDPTVLTQLATIGGGEQVPIAALQSTRIPRPPTTPAVAPGKPEELAQQPAPGPADEPPKPAAMPEPPAVAEGTEPVAAVQVDVEARLADRILQIGFPGVPLIDVVELLAQLTGVPITFDLDAMAELGVTVWDPITIELSDATAGEILEAALAGRGLAYVVQNDQILVTSPEKKRSLLRALSYTVSDLTGGDPKAAAGLAELIEEVVAPECWRGAGGRGTIEPEGGLLKVVQTDPVHYRILMFCEKLRTVRGLPLRSRYNPAIFSPATRLDRARAKLSRPIAANFFEPTPLVRILSDLEQLSGTRILVDWVALGAQGTSPDTKGSLKAEDQPLSEALDEMLRPMDLAFRVVDADTLEITSQKAYGARLELEFYPIGDLLTEGVTAGLLMGRIKDEVAPATWSDADGPGVLRCDEPSKCLIVLQSQPVQFELEALLDRWRAEKKGQANPP